jgi:hypothetical protein
MQSARRWGFVAGAALAANVFVNPAFGQPANREKWYVDRSMNVTPTPSPTPAFQYRLLPLAVELRDGNAVPIYLRLVHEQSDAARKRWMETPRPWTDLPIDQVPWSEARGLVKDMRRFFQQMDLGARRRTAEWNYTLDQGTVVDLLLPDVQSMRQYVPLLVLRSRMHIVDGHFAAAVDSLATGFAFSRHVAEAPTLINGLVAIACANQFADCVADFIERPKAPNLYWALTALPRPLIDLRKALEYEQRFFEMEFPEIRDIERPRSPGQWDALLKRLRQKMKELEPTMADEQSKQTPPPDKTGPDDAASQSPDLPAAKRYLIERSGMTAAAVDAMPPAQVLLLYILGVNHDIRDGHFTAAYLGYPEARRVLTVNAEKLKSLPNSEAARLARIWLPQIQKVQNAQSRLDRKIAALRVVEALRLHAAANQGQLPDSLDQVKVVPIPRDPGTGRAFEYRKEGGKAVLTSQLPGEPNDKFGLRYTISLK